MMRTAAPILGALLMLGCARGPALQHAAVAPRFPDMLRHANVEGATTFRVVVSPSGRADTASLRVLKSTHELFNMSLRRALPQLEWKPARNWLGRPRASEHTYVVQWTLMRGAARDSSFSTQCPEGAGDTTVVCAPEVIRRPGVCDYDCGDPIQVIAEASLPRRTPAQRAPALAELERQQARWRATRPWSFRYTESASCFGICTLGDGSRTRVVTVRSGHPSGLDSLFTRIANAIRDTAYDAVDVRYDTLYGYPREVRFDPSIYVNDDETRRTVGALTVLEAAPPRRPRKAPASKP